MARMRSMGMIEQVSSAISKSTIRVCDMAARCGKLTLFDFCTTIAVRWFEKSALKESATLQDRSPVTQTIKRVKKKIRIVLWA